MNNLADRIKVNTATTGTGTLTLGAAVTGFRDFAAAITAGDLTAGQVVPYALEAADGSGSFWETGTGIVGAAGATLTRTLRRSSTGALINIAAAAVIYLTPGAADLAAGFAYVSTAQTLQASGTLLVDSSGGALTLTLPASPSLGTNFTLVDATGSWATNNVTLARNGRTIMGQASDLICNLPDVQFTIWWNGADWRLN